MSKFLFLFSISPVQTYIEQARKTQDLYAGSYILSHLCLTAIKASELNYDDIIFPSLEANSDMHSLPNRFLAFVEKEETELKNLGISIEEAVKSEFKNIATTVIPDLSNIAEDKQVKDYLTVNWLFLPCNGDYRQKYEEIERVFGAMKQVRQFEQLPEKGRKCLICGERNVKLYHKTEHESQASPGSPRKLFSQDVYVAEYEQISPTLLQLGEGLCAVCYMKRNAGKYRKYLPGKYNSHFPSTSEIALLEALEQLPDNVRPTRTTEYDANIIFELDANKTRVRSRSFREYLQKHYTKKEIHNSEKIWREMIDEQIPILPYYAVLRFDGDSMGKWLSGAYLKGGNTEKLQDFHKKLSQQLRKFAHKVEKHFDLYEFQGRTVYAGGDDFLGFLNLQSLFVVMKQFRQEFDAIPLRQFTDAALTFSAGVVVAHYKTPLSEVLAWSRRMEHEAKEIDEHKDAFAMAVLKHSGEVHKTVFKWRADKIWTTDLFDELVTQISNDNFSSTFITNLDREFRPLVDQAGNLILEGKSGDKLPNRKVIEPELKRLLARACQMQRRNGESPSDFHTRKRNAIQDMANNVMWLHTNSRQSFENFLSALRIIDFLTRKVAS